jgi:putative hydrolase of the HAD superfamily
MQLVIPHGVKAVMFDAVGTILRPEPSVVAAYAAAGRRFGSRLTEDDLRARFRGAMAGQDAIDRDLHQGRTSEAREHQRWQALVTQVFDDVPNATPLFETLWQHFAQAEHWRLIDEAAQAWRSMTAQGLTVGIASNFDARLESISRAILPELDPSRLFISSRIGWRKPQPEFFASIEATLRLRPEQILLVGDDQENDVRGATSSGWHAVLA